jgi:hypothetical protein
MNPRESQFTGLILVTGVDKPGITQALFETLAPFSITVLDIEQVVIRDRLILTALIRLDPAAQYRHRNFIPRRSVRNHCGKDRFTPCCISEHFDIARGSF